MGKDLGTWLLNGTGAPTTGSRFTYKSLTNVLQAAREKKRNS